MLPNNADFMPGVYHTHKIEHVMHFGAMEKHTGRKKPCRRRLHQ